MDFMQKRKDQLKIKSAGEYLRNNDAPINIPELVVRGPELLDCNVRKWHLGDSIGVIGSTGIGKTSLLLWNFKHILLNNPEGICVFIACEMSERQILAKWKKATQDCPEISDRLYIITSYDEDGVTRDLSINGIKNLLKTYENVLEKKIISYVVDHLHIVRRSPTETLGDVVKTFKLMNMDLQMLGFLTSQTTKGKAGAGDLPLDATACHSCSDFEWEMTQIYTLCQPLKRVADDAGICITSYKLAKNRFKEKDDKRKEGVNYLLKFDNDTESYSNLTSNDKIKFDQWYDCVIELRKNEEKDGEYVFDTSHEVKTPSGKTVVVKTEKGRSSF